MITLYHRIMMSKKLSTVFKVHLMTAKSTFFGNMKISLVVLLVWLIIMLAIGVSVSILPMIIFVVVIWGIIHFIQFHNFQLWLKTEDAKLFFDELNEGIKNGK